MKNEKSITKNQWDNQLSITEYLNDFEVVFDVVPNCQNPD
jgi:hypothetical protein